jgi:hypothetical protein
MMHFPALGIVLALVSVLVVVGAVLTSSGCPGTAACGGPHALLKLVRSTVATVASSERLTLLVTGLVLMGLGVVGRHFAARSESKYLSSR